MKLDSAVVSGWRFAWLWFVCLVVAFEAGFGSMLFLQCSFGIYDRVDYPAHARNSLKICMLAGEFVCMFVSWGFMGARPWIVKH